ncbi:hypothetical protein GY45DRAFT_1430232 [Cubamyces sp. BRFM 1775]|nr:hypothetical protein GY45DRAFT_1430232 [Cubamyces sp. BRFM 1775]
MFATRSSNMSSGEPAANVSQDTSQLIGATLGAITYGLHITIFLQCMSYVFPQAIRTRTRGAIGRLVYVITEFLIGTVYLACNTILVRLMFVDHRLYTEGPNSWLSAHTGTAANAIDNMTLMTCTFLADGILLRRTYILWDSRKSIILLPLLLYLAATALSIPAFLQLTYPHMDPWSHNHFPFIALNFSLTASVTTLLHLLLVGRLAYTSYRARWEGPAATYMSISSILIESAAPYVFVSLVFFAFYARGSDAQHAVLPVLSQVMCISPELLILRVARRRSLAERMKTTASANAYVPTAHVESRPAPGLTIDDGSHSTANGVCCGGAAAV